MNANAITDILKDKGPQTGAQLLEHTGVEALPLWQACKRTPEIRFECIGRRFVRLDRNVEGYARLSPSIRREFLTYTVLGLETQEEETRAKAGLLREEIRRISRAKLDLAKEAIHDTVQALQERQSIRERICFLIAGDITYNMAHAVPRPEVSTGKMVRGSDLDIVAIAEDGVPPEILKTLDSAILKKKYFLLVHPNYQEEIDYLVKDVSKVRSQLVFDSFQHMIASKIIYESELLYGSAEVFAKVKKMVDEFGIPDKLARLERSAEENREAAEIHLLNCDPSQGNEAFLNLFYTREEGDEIY
ncbi:MAG: hypothetical protein H6Q07_1971 [Acidobacteria bacterium]|nr:hypothetical protein [Acidobacteriota bacterium]